MLVTQMPKCMRKVCSPSSETSARSKRGGERSEAILCQSENGKCSSTHLEESSRRPTLDRGSYRYIIHPVFSKRNKTKWVPVDFDTASSSLPPLNRQLCCLPVSTVDGRRSFLEEGHSCHSEFLIRHFKADMIHLINACLCCVGLSIIQALIREINYEYNMCIQTTTTEWFKKKTELSFHTFTSKVHLVQECNTDCCDL